jgi:hypothetical protein
MCAALHHSVSCMYQPARPLLFTTQLHVTEQIFSSIYGVLELKHFKKLTYFCLNIFYSFLGTFAKLRKVTTASSYPSTLSSIRVKQRIVMNLDISVYFEDVSRKWKFHKILRIRGTLHDV